MDIAQIIRVLALQAASAHALKQAGLDGKHPGSNHPAFAGLRESRGLGGLNPGSKPGDFFDGVFDGIAETVTEFAKAQEAKKVRLTDQQRIALLLKAETRYAGPCPFTRGEIVTPRADSGYENVGKPHVVLEALEVPFYRQDVGAGGMFGLGGIFGSHFGHQLDLRVGMITEEGKIAAMWRESWRFEPHPDAPPKEKPEMRAKAPPPSDHG